MKTFVFFASLLIHNSLFAHAASTAGAYADISISAKAELIDERQYVEILGKDIDTYDRMWDEYALWYLVVAGAICLALFIPALILFLKRRKTIKAAPEVPWDMKNAYKKWGTLGLMGDHRFYLGSWTGFFYPLLLSAFIMIVAVDVMPNFYGMLPHDKIHISILAWSVVRVTVGFWLFDAFWIRFRIYSQPYIILRQKERALIKEAQTGKLISKNDEKRFWKFSNSINSTLHRLNKQVSMEYGGTRNGILRGFGNLFRSKDPWVEFEEKKIAEIYKLYNVGEKTYEEYFEFIAHVKNKNINKLYAIFFRDSAIAEALAKAIEATKDVTPENEVTVTAYTPEGGLPDLYDAEIAKRGQMIEWLPLRPLVSCGPQEMERIAKKEGARAIEKVSAVARIIDTPSKETMGDMIDILQFHKEFWASYYIPLRNLTFICKPSFWDYITHTPNDAGAFMKICTSDSKTIKMPVAQRKTTRKSQHLEEEMAAFMQAYQNALHSLKLN